MWTNVLKKLPKKNLVTSIFSTPQSGFDYDRFGDTKLLYVKDGKLVNIVLKSDSLAKSGKYRDCWTSISSISEFQSAGKFALYHTNIFK